LYEKKENPKEAVFRIKAIISPNNYYAIWGSRHGTRSFAYNCGPDCDYCPSPAGIPSFQFTIPRLQLQTAVLDYRSRGIAYI